jgi:uncharacterized membrane protein YphA (DoxX/SURF4 family)
MAAPALSEQQQRELQVPRWGFGSRVAFRFCFVYFGLFCVTTQILPSLFPIPKVDIPDPATLPPVRPVVMWTAAHVFHIAHPLVYTGSGSGDKTFDWVLSFSLLVFSLVATGVWSVLDRKRENYIALHKWFRLFLRFALASQMLTYGMAKVIPLQMPFPYLTRLLQPYGTFSPMGVLWASIGASRSYEIFAGSAETLAGVLLIFPRTTTLGALVCLVDMIQVFMLNMTYDVPVKLFAFHLILMPLVLLAPEFSRLVNVLFLNRATGPSTQPPLFRTPRANRIALAGQVIFGLFLLGMNTYGSWNRRSTYGEARPKSALYGIWNVDQLSIDGAARPPLVTDNGRWRRAIFDFPASMSFERMDDSFASYGASINESEKTITLTMGADWKGNLTFERVAPNRLILDGDMDGHKVHMQLQRVDREKFLLVTRGFHWIQEYPFNR